MNRSYRHRHRSSSLLLLRRRRAGESDALHSPGLERSLRGDRLGINPKPALQLASAHLKRSRTGLGEESLRLLLGAADHQATLAADPDGHVAVDHEADAAEHLLLGIAVLGGDQLADPVGEILVVSHRDNHGAWALNADNRASPARPRRRASA